MKSKRNIILLALLCGLTILTASCGGVSSSSDSSDDGAPSSARQTLSPPSWTIGTWEERVTSQLRFLFSNGNVHMTSLLINTDTDFKAAYGGFLTEPVKTASEYSINVSVKGTNQTYRFVKISTTKLNYYLTTNGRRQGPITLNKQ